VLLIPKRHRRTDRQTDGRLTVALPRSALASRGKNRIEENASVSFFQTETTTHVLVYSALLTVENLSYSTSWTSVVTLEWSFRWLHKRRPKRSDSSVPADQ